MGSPALYGVERTHLLQLLIWGAASFAMGAVLLAVLRIRKERAPLAVSFAIAMAACGAAESCFALLRWRGLTERDYAGVLRLTTNLRLTMIAELWCIAGATVVLWAGITFLKRLDLLGIATALAAHGGVLFVLDRLFLARLTSGA
ncbi:MAG TPA: hypothetical protein VN607_07380 [Gemmatimonadaceae bacterium]|nr:hypothetical protein [Gemmatimonadaceae bacterium]